MDVSHAAKVRRSIRKYLDIPVEMEKIGRMLHAAIEAPSAGNVQPWKFVLVLDENTRKKIAEGCLQQHWMNTAPVHVIVVAEPGKSKRLYGERGEKQYAIMDCAAAIENMLLVATEEGLGTCWVGAYEDELLHRELGIPENRKILGVITAGYADESPPPPLRYTLENVIFIESWGSRIKDPAAYMGYTSHKVQALIAKGKLLLEKVQEKIQKV